MTKYHYGYILIIYPAEREGRIIIKQALFITMPRLDETGPMGQGAGTGRGLGHCFRRFISPKNKLAALENEEKILEEELAAIKEEKAALKDQQK